MSREEEEEEVRVADRRDVSLVFFVDFWAFFSILSLKLCFPELKMPIFDALFFFFFKFPVFFLDFEPILYY